MGGASLPHVCFVVPNDDLSVDDRLALGADTPGEFVEDIIGFLLYADAGFGPTGFGLTGSGPG